MAYFRCGQASGGGGGESYTIIITTETPDLFGQTITITKNGVVVGTTVFDSSGEAEYEVEEVGQYTVTCQSYSETVDVVNEFSVEIVGETYITVTLYSAASDTVTFTDLQGAKTATTDTSGIATGITIYYDAHNPGTITFTSSVAKDPTSLSDPYTKTITISPLITSLYIMPDNCLYWYGYNASIWSNPTGVSDYHYFDAPTTNVYTVGTNELIATNTTSPGQCAISFYSEADLTSYTGLKAIIDDTSIFTGTEGFGSLRVYHTTSLNPDGTITENPPVLRIDHSTHSGTGDHSPELVQLDITSLTGTEIVLIGTQSGSSGRTKIEIGLYACWME